MNRKEIMKFINYLEEKYPVEDWKVGSINIWPLFRIRMAFACYSRDLNNQKTFLKKKTILERVKIALVGVIESIQFLSYLILARPSFVFSGSNSHRIKINDKFYNRFFGPLVEISGLNTKDWLHIEQDITIKKDKLRPKGNLFIGPHFRFLWLKFPTKLPVLNLPSVDEVFEEMRNFSKVGSEVLSKQSIIKEAIFINKLSKLYIFLFRRLKPKAIFTLCYYSGSHLAINHSANVLRIPCIDIQHGSQGANHIAYGNWANVPKTGYSMLPSIFWNWDENSSKSITKWNANNGIKSFVGRNIWMLAWEDRNWINKYFKKLDEITFNKPIILYSLQPINDVIPELLIELVKETHNEFQWVFRVHPRQIHQLSELQEIINNSGIENYIFDLQIAYELPLPFLLKSTVFHITQWSSVAMEADDYQIHSLIIHNNGFAIFGEAYPHLSYLGINIFTKEECLLLINSLSKENVKIPNSNNIKNTWEKFLQTINEEYQKSN